MLISKLGEFGLIERFRRRIKTDASVIQGSGDDCAVLSLDKNRYQLFTCDRIAEDVDFTLKDKPYLIGRKAIAVQISDIAACAGIPRHCLVSLGMSRAMSLKFIDELLEGMRAMAKKFKVNIVGGDLSRSKKLVIDVSMLGVVKKKNLLLRKGAKAHDVIFVTGELGGSIRGKHLAFTPRLKESAFLAQNFKLHAMIDISDGLIQDLNHILESSRVGAVIYEELIPVARNSRIDEALCMGEDFELLFTMPKPEARKLMKRKIRMFKPIGEIVGKDEGVSLVGRGGLARSLKVKGYRHF
ncbi:MAG: thiamine-phosphate kinase [Candidatus Omnitrophota bacterium]